MSRLRGRLERLKQRVGVVGEMTAADREARARYAELLSLDSDDGDVAPESLGDLTPSGGPWRHYIAVFLHEEALVMLDCDDAVDTPPDA